jgi:hypothetical protein
MGCGFMMLCLIFHHIRIVRADDEDIVNVRLCHDVFRRSVALRTLTRTNCSRVFRLEAHMPAMPVPGRPTRLSYVHLQAP